ncbi:YdhK family protein [Aerococcaceae bacterium DSM 111020]|nr:YdhK family protein [Aerococcaceae bacterium DSM 111020]
MHKKLLLAACVALSVTLPVQAQELSSSTSDMSESIESSVSSETSTTETHMHMEHDESGELPEGLKEAENPKYKEGESVILDTDHMPGMQDAEAKIVGAYETIAYEVTYEDSQTGELVEEHRWVVHEETKEGQKQEEHQAFEVGDTITIDAEHMEGMKGQEAEITDVQETIVYMVDYVPTNEADAEPMRNHKWVTEEEVKPAEESSETSIDSSEDASTTSSSQDESTVSSNGE